jgi:hypothetical protein
VKELLCNRKLSRYWCRRSGKAGLKERAVM